MGGHVKIGSFVKHNTLIVALCGTLDHIVTVWSTPVTVTKPWGSLLHFLGHWSHRHVGNPGETDLSIQVWKRESHPSGNSQLELQQKDDLKSGGGDLWSPVSFSNPPTDVILRKVQLELHRNSHRTGWWMGTARLWGWTALRVQIMHLWHEHRMLKASRSASERAHKVLTQRKYACAVWLLWPLCKKCALLTGWCMICPA